jgi:hypothetical protein
MLDGRSGEGGGDSQPPCDSGVGALVQDLQAGLGTDRYVMLVDAVAAHHMHTFHYLLHRHQHPVHLLAHLKNHTTEYR